MLFFEKESCKVTDYVTNMWNYVERPLNRLFRTKKKHFLRGFVNCNHQHIKFLAALSARNTIGQSARLGDQVIFSLSRSQMLVASGDRAPLEHSLAWIVAGVTMSVDMNIQHDFLRCQNLKPILPMSVPVTLIPGYFWQHEKYKTEDQI